MMNLHSLELLTADAPRTTQRVDAEIHGCCLTGSRNDPRDPASRFGNTADMMRGYLHEMAPRLGIYGEVTIGAK